MSNCVGFYKEKLTGSWVQSGASYANSDLFGLFLDHFTYNGIDGEEQSWTVKDQTYYYNVYLTGDESGECTLFVKGNYFGFKSTMGRIMFTEDYNHFTLQCNDSKFFFDRE